MTTGDHGPAEEKPVAADNGGGAPAGPVEFHPDRTHVFAALIMAGISFLVIGAAPLYLFWILAFPAAFIWWVMRSRTVVGERGISIRYAFRSGIEVSWDEIEGVGFKGSTTLLRTTSGKNHALPGVTFNSLPKLAQASRGRIPDALTSGLEALDGKYSVISQDGNEVLMSEEEHKAYLAERVRREQRRRTDAPEAEDTENTEVDENR